MVRRAEALMETQRRSKKRLLGEVEVTLPAPHFCTCTCNRLLTCTSPPTCTTPPTCTSPLHQALGGGKRARVEGGGDMGGWGQEVGKDKMSQ